jgi:hypothetical protein
VSSTLHLSMLGEIFCKAETAICGLRNERRESIRRTLDRVNYPHIFKFPHLNQSTMAVSWKIIFPLLITLVLSGPCSTPTPTAFPDQTQSESEAPLPTVKPELVKRDDYPPQFCGWLDGLSSYAPCNAFSTCIWRTDVSAVGCCRDTTNLNTCGMFTTCINYSDLGAASLSKSDSLLLLW